jgi:hypothetical protein
MHAAVSAMGLVPGLTDGHGFPGSKVPTLTDVSGVIERSSVPMNLAQRDSQGVHGDSHRQR